jgi:hypothetical protein
MRIGEDSIDNLSPDDPRSAAVFVRPTGEYEVLKPIAGPTAKAPKGLSRFHGSLTIVGSFLAVAFVAATAVHYYLVGPPLDRPGVGDVAVGSEEVVPPAEHLGDPQIVPEEQDPEMLPDEEVLTASVQRRSPARRRALRAAYRAQRDPHPSPLWVSEFTPSRLVIYVENGEIRSRTESVPVLFKRPVSFSN